MMTLPQPSGPRRPTMQPGRPQSRTLRAAGVAVTALSLAFLLAALLIPHPAWVRMWLLCGGLFFAAKVAVLPTRDMAAFAFCWPGMDARAFGRKAAKSSPLPGRGLANLLVGLGLIFGVGGFGVLTLMHSHELAAGRPLARGVSIFIAVFWAARLAVQLFVFDARPFLTNGWRKLGYHALTAGFVFFTAVYGWAAVR